MSANAFRLLDYLFEQPYINVNAARDHLGVSYVAANGLIRELCQLEVLSETTGGSRNRVFRFGPYIDLFADAAASPVEHVQPQPTRLLKRMAVMAFVLFPAPRHLMPNSAAYWFLVQIGMIIGFASSWPANVWLVKRGIKVPM